MAGRFVFGADPRKTSIRIAVILLGTWIVFRYLLLTVRTDGISMLPTYDSGTLRIVSRVSYVVGRPERGDVVAIRLAGEAVVYIKRIVGLPGERLRIAHGIVYVNDQRLAEPYVSRRAAWELGETRLGADEFFVVGDNRGMSIADHTLGRARGSRIIGRVIL